MKAMIATPGDVAPLTFRDVADPDPDSESLVVEVRACSLNRGELKLLATRPDWRPGQDVAGVVIRGTPDGAGPPVGSRVAAVVDEAGWAERVAVPIDRCCVLPEGVGFEAGATAGVAGLTALRALRIGGSVLGARVLVTGASGGVGRFAVQLARSGGAYVAAHVGDVGRAEGLNRLGATSVVVGDDDLGGPFDVVIDTVAGAVLERAIRALAPNAVAVLVGMASGAPSSVGLFDFERGVDARVQPFRLYRTDVHTFGADLTYLTTSMAAGRIEAPIGMSVAWSELPRAIEALRDRRVLGKVVFRPEGADVGLR